MKNEIWNNDTVEVFDFLLENNIENHLSEEEMWAEAAETVNETRLDMVTNLNIATDRLIAVGTRVRWDATYRLHKELKARNLGMALLEAMDLFYGDNSFSVYVEDGSLFVRQGSHDNPVKPAIIEIREGSLENNTPCGHYAEHVFGWETEKISA